jgi:hypothetical protein
MTKATAPTFTEDEIKQIEATAPTFTEDEIKQMQAAEDEMEERALWGRTTMDSMDFETCGKVHELIRALGDIDQRFVSWTKGDEQDDVVVTINLRSFTVQNTGEASNLSIK